jgi:CoA:oxalate CoA-transferase
VAAMGQPELEHDPRFATRLARRENWAELREIIGRWLDRFQTVEAALGALTAARIPCAPVLSPAEVVAHAHLAERGAFPSVPHPARDYVRITATPYHVDGRAVVPSGPAPHRVGEHTQTVLTDVLGYSPERIEELRKLGAIEVP